jgi:hypothetical protein
MAGSFGAAAIFDVCALAVIVLAIRMRRSPSAGQAPAAEAIRTADTAPAVRR